MELPYLASISIYPIKSLDAVSLKTARVLLSGALADDRRFAIFDASGQYVNGKRTARVHLLRSTYDPVTRSLALSNGSDSHPKMFKLDADRAALQEWLSEFFGFAVLFREDINAGFPDDSDSPGPTLISTATLREVGGWFGLTIGQARARFRANLEVDGVPAFWEDQLYGERGTTVRFSVGDVIFDGVNPCQRCVVPARDAVSGIDVRDFAKRFVEMRRKRLPDWATLSRFNHFYRLAVNTKLVANQSALNLTVGDRIKVLGLHTDAPPSISVPQTDPKPVAHPARWSGELIVTSVSQNTPDIRTFRLSSTHGGPLPFTYLPGQHLNLELSIDGITHRRCYTIASSPTQKDYVELTVKREAAGTVSQYLHDHLRQGMHLRVSGPGGRFTFTGDEADSIVLIGAGVGITPLMSVARYLTDQRWQGSIDLIYSVKDERSIIFRDELNSLAKQFPNLHVTTTLTQERSANWTGPRGRISSDLLRGILQHGTRQRMHICGPIEMASATANMLRDIGVRSDQIKTEAFGGAEPRISSTIAEQNGQIIGTATFTNSGKSAPIYAAQNILDVAASVGVVIDHGCRAGVCGRCKVRLLSGNVAMEMDDGLTEDEKQNGFILACQAKPRNSVAVEA